jgi:outer membrane protein TolC
LQSVLFIALANVIIFLWFGSHMPALAKEGNLPMPKLHFLSATINKTFTLRESVELAIANYPNIKNAISRIQAARANITLAKTAYLPNFDLAIQEARNTQNVIAGIVLPQSQNLDAIPIQSGKVTSSSSMSSIFSSNYAANFNWLLYDFGKRGANVEYARAAHKLAQNNLKLTELDVAYVCADSYLNAIATQQTIISTQAAYDRMKAAAIAVKSQVDAGLRPGVDAARADFDVSDTKIGLIKAERAYELAKVDLAERMGIAGSQIEVVPDALIKKPTRRYTIPVKMDFSTHPLALVNQSATITRAARVHVIDRTWYPHLWFNSAFWGRGSGAQHQSPPVAAGAIPQVANWMAGLQVSFPIMEIFSIKAERRAAYASEMAEKANFDLAIQILEKKDAQARILLNEARKIADETPQLVEAARENEVKVLERYKAGLTNMVSVAEAERILAKAEVEDALAQVEVWRSILAVGYVQGNLKPFLSLVEAAEGVASK